MEEPRRATGSVSIFVFDETWHRSESAEQTYHDLVNNAPASNVRSYTNQPTSDNPRSPSIPATRRPAARLASSGRRSQRAFVVKC